MTTPPGWSCFLLPVGGKRKGSPDTGEPFSCTQKKLTMEHGEHLCYNPRYDAKSPEVPEPEKLRAERKQQWKKKKRHIGCIG